MRSALKRVVLSVAACAVLAVGPAHAAPGTITDDLKAVVDRVLLILKDPAYAAPEMKDERNKLIHNAASGTFDWEEMAKRTLGPHWRDITAAQRREFVDIFVDFLENTYISKIDLFLKEAKNFTSKNILYLKETIEQGRYALVETKIIFNDKELPLNYKLIQKKDSWVVYDLTIEGIGIVANYRTQFNEILANGTFDTLLQKLRTKESVEDIHIDAAKPKQAAAGTAQ